MCEVKEKRTNQFLDIYNNNEQFGHVVGFPHQFHFVQTDNATYDFTSHQFQTDSVMFS